MNMMNRAAGILLSVTSLPSRYGIGCFDKAAYDFVDWLKEAGQTFWQILPLGPTSYGDSPYQSFSTHAGNPYFISLETLIDEGVLTREECDQALEEGDKMSGSTTDAIRFCARPISAARSAVTLPISSSSGKTVGGWTTMRCLWL